MRTGIYYFVENFFVSFPILNPYLIAFKILIKISIKLFSFYLLTQINPTFFVQIHIHEFYIFWRHVLTIDKNALI